MEAELTHHFQGVAMRQPALRFKLLGAAASTVDDSPLWMGTEEYSKLTHDLRKEEKEAAAKAAEEAKVAASGVKEVAAGAGGEVDAPASNIRTAGIYNHFHDPVILSTETKPHPTKPGKTIDIHHYQYTCKVIVPVEEGGDGKTECGHTRMETGTSNGNLFKHFKKAAKDNCPTHTRILAELESKSKHTATQVVNGEVVRMMSWEERFPHHIYYTAETYLDYAPFTRSRREGNRGLLSSLKPGYVPPTRETQINMMETMSELCDEEMKIDFSRWRRDIGPGWLGEATDGLTKHGKHFVTFNGFVIEDDPLQLSTFVFDYHEYPGSGGADALRDDWEKTERRYGIVASDRGKPTADGAAPQQLAIEKLTGEKGRTCANHQEARAAKAAFETRNPEANRVIRKYRGLSRLARTSTMYKNDVKKYEKDVMNVEKPTEMVLPNATRWTGNSRTMTRTNEKEPALRKLHAKPEDDGTEETTAGDADEDDSDSGSSSESESDEVAPVRSAKNVRKYRERVEARSLTPAEWTSGKDLEAVMATSQEVINLWQKQSTTTLENRLTLARALIVVNTADEVNRLQMTKLTSAEGTVTYSRNPDSVSADKLMPCANTAREVYSEELEERFFAPDKIADEDLIALMLNWPADFKAALGNDVRLIARAKRVFAHALDAIEEELLESVAAATAARPPKKTKPTVEDPTRSKPISMMSMAMSEGFSGVTEAVED